MEINNHVKGIEMSIRKIAEMVTPNCVRFDIGEPDFDTPGHIKDAAMRSIETHPSAYASVRGIPELIDAIVRYESKKNLDVVSNNVMVTNGGMGALFCAFQGLLEPSKQPQIILPDPFWSPYALILNSLGRSFLTAPFIRNGKLDLAPLEESLTKDIRFILLNSPANPTGEILSKEDLETLASFVKEHDLSVISDEVYERILFDAKFHSIASFIPERTIRINSCSKTYSMTGWRVGWMTGPKDIVFELLKCNRAMTASVNIYAQYAALAALEGNQECVDSMIIEYRKRKAVMEERVKGLGWSYPKIDGAFYLFADTGREGWEYAHHLIRECGVAAIPGSAFGPSGRTSLRLCFGSANGDQIEEGFDRIEKDVKRNGK